MMLMYCAFRKCSETISKILSDQGCDNLGTTEFLGHETLVRVVLCLLVLVFGGQGKPC